MFRSWLCSSPISNKLLPKVKEVGADITHFDFEDSVPTSLKQQAREEFLKQSSSFNQHITALRINSLSSVDGLLDLIFLHQNNLRPDIIILAKAIIPNDIELVNSILNSSHNLKRIKVFAVVETADSYSIIKSHGFNARGLDGIIFGAADFALDLGLSLFKNNLRSYKSELVLAAKRNKILIIDSPCFKINDINSLEEELEEALELGFDGKIAIHPDQVKLINQAFMPSKENIQLAEDIIMSNEESGGRSIMRLKNRMFGPPFIKHAKRILSGTKS